MKHLEACTVAELAQHPLFESVRLVSDMHWVFITFELKDRSASYHVEIETNNSTWLIVDHTGENWHSSGVHLNTDHAIEGALHKLDLILRGE